MLRKLIMFVITSGLAKHLLDRYLRRRVAGLRATAAVSASRASAISALDPSSPTRKAQDALQIFKASRSSRARDVPLGQDRSLVVVPDSLQEELDPEAPRTPIRS